METIQGTVSHITYTAQDTGFTIARLQTREEKDSIVILGTLPSLQVGESLLCRGSWKNHSQYGKQFEVASFEACRPSDLLGIERYLESGLIKGIGPSYAKKIVKKFGLDTLKILDETPHRLEEVEGIGKKRLHKIVTCWQEHHAIRDVMIFLRGHGVSTNYAHKIYKVYGHQSIERVSEDPFSLIRIIDGIGFKTADAIATSVGFAKDSPQRVDAGISHAFLELAKEGHTCTPRQSFIDLVTALLEVPSTLVAERIDALLLEKRIYSEQERLWPSTYHLAETSIAKEILRLATSHSSLRQIQQDKAIEWVQQKLHLTLAPEQVEAVQKGTSEKTLIITGGPGTGKSTITKAILRISEALTSKILLAAPTGRAAKRMSEITHKKAFTIHSLLEMDFLTGQFKRNEKNPLSADLLIIDEASMIDTRLMQSLLKAIPSHCRLLLIGDVDQLPSVGPGNVLKDLINANVIPVIRLQKIFRQAAHSRIITNAHKVNQGHFPDLTPMPGSDFLFFPKEAPEEILAEILLQAQGYFPSCKDKIQILSPMKKGALGTENLNLLLQKTFNPSTKPLIRLGRQFHLHDRVMQTKNNYEKEVYNGDIGWITLIDEEEEIIEVSFDGRAVLYDFTELDELLLAYAVSIHKYQGSECECIVLPMHTSHFKLLSKNLLYTGITRGKKKVVLIGSMKAIAIAIKKADAQQRHTGLQEKLCSTFATTPCS